MSLLRILNIQMIPEIKKKQRALALITLGIKVFGGYFAYYLPWIVYCSHYSWVRQDMMINLGFIAKRQIQDLSDRLVPHQHGS